MAIYNDKPIEQRVSKFSFLPTGSYQSAVKKRLDIRQFSTYKIYDPKPDGITIAGPQTRYVDQYYWEDYYTVVYQPFVNPYPIPPNEP